MFADPNLEGKTAEEDWEFSSEESEGTAMHRIVDGKRKILFDSSREGADVDSFFQELLNGAYDSKTEVDTDDSTTGESAVEA